VIWTVIAINPTTERAETEVFDLSPDSDKAELAAARELPGKTIVAMVKGAHMNSTHLPETTLSLYHTRR